MESLARECYHRANNQGAMTGGSSYNYRDSDPLGNAMLAGNAMIGVVHNGDILEKAIRLEQRTLVNYIKAFDQFQKVRRVDNNGFVWPSRANSEVVPIDKLAPTGS